MRNTLYYGDNLDVLREHIRDESVDLIYLDPPFNSNRSYNVLFREESGKASAAQIEAFDDTWHWANAVETYEYLVTQVNGRVGTLMAALHSVLVGGGPAKGNQMMAYLVMMAARLVELRRALKPTGSIYLHCDPTASHYLKVVMDAVFGAENFINELIWQRTLPHGNVSKKFGASHDTVLFFRKTSQSTWIGSHLPHRAEYLEQFYKYWEPDGRRYRLISCINPNPDRPNLTYDWKGVTRVWKYTRERMQRMDEAGLLVYSKSGIPSYKGYLEDMKGTPAQDIWTDIPPLMGSSVERQGYPTQKPVALLERIISASSNPGDVVLDPFAGCGTTVVAAQKLGRQWLGIDITHLSIGLLKNRLLRDFNQRAGKEYDVKGEPVDLESARQLALDNRYGFQAWALSLVPAHMIAGADGNSPKKGADKGIDGLITFIDDGSHKPKRIIVQVKSGHVNRGDVGELRGTIEREGAVIGVFLTLEKATRNMREEAADAGFYESPYWNKKYPRIQVLEVEEMLKGAQVKMPPLTTTFAATGKEQGTGGYTLPLGLGDAR